MPIGIHQRNGTSCVILANPLHCGIGGPAALTPLFYARGSAIPLHSAGSYLVQRCQLHVVMAQCVSDIVHRLIEDLVNIFIVSMTVLLIDVRHHFVVNFM